MLKNIKACLFDMDGTLLDSMHIWKDIDIEFLGKYGYELPPTLQREIEGMSFRETAIYIKDKFGLMEDVDTIMDIWNEMAYQKYSEEIFFKEGAFEFIKMLKEKAFFEEGVSEEEKYFRYFEFLKNSIKEKFGNLNASYLEAVCEELYTELFENGDN